MTTDMTVASVAKRRPRFPGKRWAAIVGIVAIAAVVCGWWVATHLNLNPRYEVGQEVDRLNGVVVYYNGGVSHCAERNLAPDGYNLGIRYQCVEFVKRYYYEHLDHKMPDSYGHAKQFFDPALADGELNTQRDLVQYRNGGEAQPHPDDLLVFGASPLNRYGHVAIVSAVSDTEMEVVQQNPGPYAPSRVRLALVSEGGHWRCVDERVLGWLRLRPEEAAARELRPVDPD